MSRNGHMSKTCLRFDLMRAREKLRGVVAVSEKAPLGLKRRSFVLFTLANEGHDVSSSKS
jgi:hypothetical protein